MRDPEARRVRGTGPAGPNGQRPADEPLPEGRYPGIGRVETGETSPLKRLLDITVGGLMIGILWPVFALAALLIKMESPGPVLIKQDRVGLNGGAVRYLTFGARHHSGRGSDRGGRLRTGDRRRRRLSPKGRPPHATAIGWSLRKTTVDELPQLVNVVKGDMSLVGPRPDLPEIVEAWPPHFRQRHQVKPGMTGLAQVNGRSDLTHYEKVRYDLRYVRRHPLSIDLMILVRTLRLVTTKKGAR